MVASLPRRVAHCLLALAVRAVHFTSVQNDKPCLASQTKDPFPTFAQRCLLNNKPRAQVVLFTPPGTKGTPAPPGVSLGQTASAGRHKVRACDQAAKVTCCETPKQHRYHCEVGHVLKLARSGKADHKLSPARSQHSATQDARKAGQRPHLTAQPHTLTWEEQITSGFHRTRPPGRWDPPGSAHRCHCADEPPWLTRPAPVRNGRWAVPSLPVR